MTLTRLPNAELLLSRFLLADPDVVASPLGSDTYTEIPAGFTSWPAARLTRVGGTPLFDVPLVIDEPRIQVDVWGGPKSITCDIAETIRAALAAPGRLPFTVPGAGTLSCVVTFGTLRYLPDTTWDPARPRYLFDVVVQTRAAPVPVGQ